MDLARKKKEAPDIRLSAILKIIEISPLLFFGW